MTTAKSPVSKKKLSIPAVLSEAWQLVYGLKWATFWLGLVLGFITFIASIVVFTSISPLLHTLAPSIFPASGLLTTAKLSTQQALPQPTTSSILISLLVMTIILTLIYLLAWFISCTLVMLGVRQSIGLPAKSGLAFRDCQNASQQLVGLFFILFAIIIAFSFVGHILAKIPALGRILKWACALATYYFAWATTTFAVPLSVTRRYPAMVAFKLGLQAMNRNWLDVILLYVIMIVIIAISAIPLGLGMIWTIPMGLATTGIIFRDVFGLLKRQQAPISAEEIVEEPEELPEEPTSEEDLPEHLDTEEEHPLEEPHGEIAAEEELPTEELLPEEEPPAEETPPENEPPADDSNPPKNT